MSRVGLVPPCSLQKSSRDSSYHNLCLISIAEIEISSSDCDEAGVFNAISLTLSLFPTAELMDLQICDLFKLSCPD